ncbi:hypothetical protein KC365_g122 [Hortaea werneckii]|nr:hypothetical protein KC365_g122 [Hortaea werneckii]
MKLTRGYRSLTVERMTVRISCNTLRLFRVAIATPAHGHLTSDFPFQADAHSSIQVSVPPNPRLHRACSFDSPYHPRGIHSSP